MQEDKSKNPTTKGLGKELGKSGTVIFKGIITQEEYNSKLSNIITANRIYDTMRRSDATVRSTLQVVKLPILSTEWQLEAASDSKEDEYVRNFCDRELFGRNVDFHHFMKEGLTLFDFGFSVCEKVYELTDFEGQTRIGIGKLSYRKQRSIQAWETQDGKPGVTQMLQDGTGLVNIPMVKLIVFTNDKEGDNFEGMSLLRYAYKHWDIKDKLDLVNAIALEKLAVGVPVLKKPADANDTDLANAREALREFRANEEGYQEIPIGWELEMMDLKANSTKDVIPTIKYHDRQIQMSVLAQFLSLGGSDASGSRAVSEDHSKLFLLSEEAAAKNLQSTLQEQLIKQLCDLNFANLPNGYPKLTFSKIGDEDATALATNVKELMAAGALTYDAELEEHLRKVLRLPDLPDLLKKQFEEDLKNQIKAKKEAAKSGKTELDPNKEDDADDDLPDDPKKDPEKKADDAIKAAADARTKLLEVIS